MTNIVLTERIERRIYFIRGQKVIMDSDLAELYGVRTSNLNKAVSRNTGRFPKDFMFQLNREEAHSLRFQFGISKAGKGGRRYKPYVFTEQGVAMLSSVLNSERAVRVNIEIMRAFVKMRELMTTHKDLARRLDNLEKKYDTRFKAVFDAIRRLIMPMEKPKRRIGFRSG